MEKNKEQLDTYQGISPILQHSRSPSLLQYEKCRMKLQKQLHCRKRAIQHLVCVLNLCDQKKIVLQFLTCNVRFLQFMK